MTKLQKSWVVFWLLVARVLHIKDMMIQDTDGEVIARRSRLL